MTPANSNMNNGVAIPPTPSAVTRPMTLRHFQSSPSLPLYTAGAGPTGGMTLPRTRTNPPPPRGFAEIPQEEEEEEDDINFDIPQSRDEKPESYPNGPIRIYESGVDLFYEPSVEIASRYDVIINVASEVKNPYHVAEEAARKASLPIQPSLNVGVLAEGSPNAGSPTTPKATPITTEPPMNIFAAIPQKRPEYIHMPWEHNTDIVSDLHDLVRVIDDRVKQGKTVLVHCQCGVSRSASLIVAYGMYTNPGLSVQEAYDAVKKRSKWIGPNMSLIMQLQEYRSSMLRNIRRDHGYQSQVFTLPRKSSIVQSAASTNDSFDTKTPSEPATPRTAPFNPDEPRSPKRLNSSEMGPFSAGPVEPGSASFWDTAFRRSWGSSNHGNEDASSMHMHMPMPMPNLSLVTDTNYVDPKGHVVPVVTMLQNDPSPVQQQQPVQPPTAAPPPMFSRPLPFRRDYDNDTPMTEAPPVEPLLSPRSTEFGMASLIPPTNVESNDTFHILSPTSEFPKYPIVFPSPIHATENPTVAPAVGAPPPPPARDAPVPPRVRDMPMESLDSIFSPTSTSFPPFNIQPLDFMDDLEPHPRQQARIDSLIPPSPPLNLSDPPKSNRRLRTKFSAPNLSECIKLHKIQTDIANKLPQRPAEAEEALLSPRAHTFVVNPFHRLPEPINEEPASFGAAHGLTPTAEQSQNMTDKDSPSTPTPSDPRSPVVQFGISPITRNIFNMLG